MNTAAYTEWKNDHKTSESSFQALPESTNDHYKIIINEWTDSSDKHWLTICTVTCFTATMRRLHAYYATQYNSQSFIGKSASHAYHKLNTCKILATLNVHVCTIYNWLSNKTVLLVCNLFSKPFIPFCWKLINKFMGIA